MKYAPVFPDRFGSMQHARSFLSEFVQYYNPDHHHTGIGLHTPTDIEDGLAADTDQRRRWTLAAARAATPHRFIKSLDPKILDLPDAAWINPPITQTGDQEQGIDSTAAQLLLASTTLTNSAAAGYTHWTGRRSAASATTSGPQPPATGTTSRCAPC